MAPRLDSEPPPVASPPAGAGTADREAEPGAPRPHDLRDPAADPRFAGAAGELRGHVEVSGDDPFPRVWSLVLRPSNTLYGRELAAERVVEFDDGSQDFTVRGLPLAGYDVVAEAEGMNGIPLPVLVDRRNSSPFVNLRMAPAGFLEGRVLSADGIPADGFPLTLARLDAGSDGGSSVTLTTDALGRFRFERVLDGPYQLILGLATSPVVPEKRSLRFQAPSMILPDIELPPLGHLVLKLVDEDRRSLPDAAVKGSGNQGGVFEGATDAYGAFEVRYLPAGRFRVRLELEGFVPKRITLELGEGESKELTLQMFPES